jgi:glutathione S-transferase
MAAGAFSLADAALYGKISLLPKLGVQTVGSRPQLAAWMKRVQAVEGMQAITA